MSADEETSSGEPSRFGRYPRYRRAFRTPVGRRDQHADLSHKLPAHATESVSRTLLRVVPLIYGALLGATSQNFWFWVSVSLLCSIAFDLYMGRHSIVRRLLRGARLLVCRIFMALAAALLAPIGWFGGSLPDAIGQRRCESRRNAG